MPRTFLVAAGERAVKTFAQTLIAVLTLSSAPLDVLHTAWVGDLSLAAGATLLSVLTSLAGLVPATAAGPAADPLPADVPAPAKHAADPVPLLPPVPAPLATVGDTHGI